MYSITIPGTGVKVFGPSKIHVLDFNTVIDSTVPAEPGLYYATKLLKPESAEVVQAAIKNLLDWYLRC
jgi:hypothetical protein